MSPQPAADLLDLYDTDVIAIQKAWDGLRSAHQKYHRNYTALEREIISRFAEIGFTVDVKWYEYEISGVKQEGLTPEISVTGRVVPVAFDRDRQVREVTSNVLGIPGEEGVIKTDPDTYRRFAEGQRQEHGKGGHSHDHGSGAHHH